MPRTILAISAIAFVLALPSSSPAAPSKCAASKMSCVAKKTTGQLKCHVRAEKTGVSPVSDPDISACVQKARDKFRESDVPPRGCFAKLEAKYVGQCLPTNNALALDTKVEAFIDDVVTDLDPSYPGAVQNACSAGKKACVAKKAAALVKCHMKQARPGSALESLTACLQRAMDRFDGGPTPSKSCFARLEAKYAGACLTTNDTAELEAKTDAFVNDAVCAIDPGSPACAAVPTPIPTPVPTCTPGATPSPNPNHSCCYVSGYGCANNINGGDCIPLGGTLVLGGFCMCGGACVVP